MELPLLAIELADKPHHPDTGSRSSPAPFFLIILNSTPIRADELINDFAAGETAPCRGLIIHEPATPVPEINGEHHTMASMASHVCTSYRLDKPILQISVAIWH